MKLRNHQFSIRPPIFKNYEHPWYTYQNNEKDIGQQWVYDSSLNKPNPPTQEAVDKAQFKDKTYRWNGSVRSGNKRTS